MYLENSHSMAGYFLSATDFNNQIDRFITDLSLKGRFPGKVKAYTISDGVVAYTSLEQFRNELDPASKKRVTVGKGSPLADIFAKVCQNTTGDTLSILITDGIPSGTNEQLNGYDEPAKKKYYNKDHADRLRNDLKKSINRYADKIGVLVYAYRSEFLSTKDHPYFKLDNNKSGKTLGEFTARPYYLFVLGKPELLMQFQKQCEGIMGAEESLAIGAAMLPASDISVTPYFKQMQNVLVEGESLIFKNRSTNYQFGLLANFDDLPQGLADADYLTKNLRVFINDTAHPSFEVEVIDKQEITDKQYRKNTDKAREALNSNTHLMIINIKDYQPTRGDKLSLRIANQTDGWPKHWSSNDDLNIALDDNKTFGFIYVVEGISQAFSQADETYLIEKEINLKIN